MSTTVDERIVAAKFDASDFEKGVDKTVKKLDELKKSLDLKEATKGVTEFAEKTEASTNSIGKSLEKLTDRFTTFTGMIKQKILSGLADEVANVFLRMEQSVKGFIKSISSDQISAGMSKYEQMLTSVRVMMSAGETESSAYGAIGQLREYSDQTSYSLSQMTDALSKMKAAGVDLDTATRSVEGIANACANAGINATDAQRAFFNLSQAYSSGVLKYTDYRSLELLNMTTKDFKQQLLEAAVEAKTLKKNADGTYTTINKFNKKVTAGKKVTEKNLQDMLRYNFVTSDVMNQLFGGTFFFDEAKFKEYKNKYKTLDEAIAAAKKDYGETAVNAYLAAREARSFTDVINTLKDVVSTGWATTFEHLFGQLEEAKKFFTNLAEGELADVIYKIGEYRNAILEYWNDLEHGGAGGKAFRQAILNISEALGILMNTFQYVLPGFKDLYNTEEEGQPVLEEIGETLFRLTLQFKKFTKNLKEGADNFRDFMLNDKIMEKGPTRIELIRKVLSNLGAVFGIVARAVGIAFSTISKAFYTLMPVFDGFLIILDKVTAPLVKLRDESTAFDDLENSINNILKVIKPVAEFLGKISGIAGDILAFIAQMALDTITSNLQFFSDILGIFVELITGNSAQMEKGEGVIARIGADFEGIKNACKEGLKAVNDFFTALIVDIRKLLGLTGSEGDGEEGGIFSGITNFFKTNQFVMDAKKWVNQAIIDIGDFIKSIPSRIKRFGANIFETLYNLFFTVEGRYENGKLQSGYVLTPLGKWLDEVITSIKDFVISIPDRIINGVGKIGSWIDDVFNSLFGERTIANGTGGVTVKTKNEKGEWVTAATTTINSRFDEFLYEVKNSIREWFDDLPNKIQKMLAGVGGFLTKLINTIDEFMFGKKQTTVVKNVDVNGKTTVQKITTRYKTGFSKFLDTAIKEIKKFIKKIPEYIKAGIKGAGDIIQVLINALFGKNENEKQADSKDIEEKLEKPFLGINISRILDTIKDIGKTILNEIARIFTGSDNIEDNEKWFSEKIAEGITWIKTKAEEAFPKVLEFIASLPTKIAGLFKDDSSEEQTTIQKAISGFATTIGGFIADIPTTLLKLVDGLAVEFDKVWTSLYDKVLGSSNGNKGTVYPNAMAGDPRFHVKSKWEIFVEQLGKTISNVFKKLPTWVEEGITLALTGLENLVNKITDWFKGQTIVSQVDDLSNNMQQGIDDMAQNAAQTADDNTNEGSPLWNAVVKLGQSVFELLKTVIPKWVSDAWKWISETASGIWDGISSIFDGNPPTTDLGLATYNAAMKIIKYVQEHIIPFFKNIWSFVRAKTAEIWDGLGAIFDGHEPASELAKAVKKAGSTIVNFVVKHLPAFISGIWTSIKAKVDLIWKGINLLFSEPAPDDQLQGAADDAGGKIVAFFKEKLPGIISGIWTDIGDAVNVVWNGVASIFTGEIPEDERSQAIANIIKAIGSFLTTDLPKAISSLWNPSKKDDSKMKQYLEDTVKVTPNTAKKMSEGFVKGFKKIDTNLKEETNNPGFWSFLDGIGPAILNGLQKVLDFLSNIGDFIADVLLGKTTVADQVEKVYGKEKPELRAAFKNIGESMKKFFLDTIPNLIGSAIGTIAAEAPKWFAKLFDAMGTAKKTAEDKAAQEAENPDSEEEEDAIKAATGILDIVKTFIESVSSIATDNTLAAVAIIFGIVAILKALRSLFSIADDAEAITGTLKWAAITIAIAGLVGFLSSLMSIVQSGDEQKIADAERILDKLSEFMDKIIWIVGIINVGKIIAGFEEWRAAANKSKQLNVLTGDADKNPLFGLISGFTDGIGNFFKAFGETAGIGAGTELLATHVDSSLSILGDSLMDFTSTLTDIMQMFDPLINKLVSANDRLDTAISGVEKMGKLFRVFFQTFSGMYTSASGDWKIDEFAKVDITQQWDSKTIQNATDKYIGSLETGLEMYYKISIFMEKFADALSKFDSVSDVEAKLEGLIGDDGLFKSDTFINFLKDMFKTLDTAFNESGVSNKKFNVYDSAFVGMSAALEVLSDALSIFGSGLSGLNEDNVKAFDKTLDVMQKLILALEDKKISESSWEKFISGDNTLSALGHQLSLFGSNMKTFVTSIRDIPGFDSDEMKKKTTNQIDAVMTIAKDLATAATYAHLGNVVGFVGTMQNLPAIANYLGEFVTNMHRVLSDYEGNPISTQRIQDISNVTNAIANLLMPFSDWNTDYDLTGIVNLLNEGLTGEYGNKLAASLKQILHNVSIVLKDESAMEEVDNAGKIVAKQFHDSIQNAFDTDPELQIKITPVLNMDSLKQNFVDTFGLNAEEDINWKDLMQSVSGANATVDQNRIDSATLYQEIGRVTTAVNSLSDSQVSVGDLIAAFASMQIRTDTGALVGELTPGIDEAIGRRIWLVEQGLTT